jgi:hypothetical protein
MTDAKMGVVGENYQPELTITQFVIPAGAGATYSASNNIATFTTNAAHGLTTNPAAGVPPNYFVTFGGSTSAPTGTGILVGNIFRILSIPSTTTFTFYCTLSALTVTSATVIPVFMAPFTAYPGSSFQNQVPTIAVNYPGPQGPYGAFVNCLLGANCNITYNPDNTTVILDGYTTPQLPGGTTPTVAPVYRNLVAASTSGQVWMYGPDTIIQANGTTATSRISVIE